MDLDSMCNEAEHKLPQKLTDSMRKNQKPFEMRNLLAVDRSSLNLEPFEESHIKEVMLSGQLERGEQIWILHDSQTDSCNPVACMNAYAHVVIYIGKTEDVHEVVHISSAPLTRGLLKAKIRRQNVMEVIKPRDHVFLGHKIPDCEVSANLREEIVRRAVKCTEKPSILFDYHYRFDRFECQVSNLIPTLRTNCESFCNMILFDIPHSTQAPYTIRCLRGILINVPNQI